MILEEDGRLNSSGRCTTTSRNSRPDKRAITIRMLLTHSGGLEAGAPLYRTAHGRARVPRADQLAHVAYPPGTQTVYSDWDMVVLQAVIERITGVPLDGVSARFSVRSECATRGSGRTRTDAAFRCALRRQSVDSGRGGLLRGIVNDGTPGHSAASRVTPACSPVPATSRCSRQILLNGGAYAGVRIFAPGDDRRWTARQSDAEPRARLGYARAGSERGRYFSPRASANRIHRDVALDRSGPRRVRRAVDESRQFAWRQRAAYWQCGERSLMQCNRQ